MSLQPGYVRYPLASDQQTLYDQMVAFIKSKVPSWVDNDANLEVWVMQVMASQGSDLRTLASDVPDDIFRYFGAVFLSLPPIDATAASATTTWNVRDGQGYRVDAGTFVTIRSDTGEDIAFQTVNDVVFFAGTTQMTGVLIRAVDPGVAGSGLGTVGSAIDLRTTLDFVTSVVLESITTGGQDAETVSEYNDRLARRIRRLSQRPILPDDFSAMALDIPSIFRAVAIDGYDPVANTFNNQRMIAVSGIDEQGQNLAPDIKQELSDYYEANREINFIVNVMDPNRTQIDVSYNVISVNGFDAPSVKAAIDAALADYLSPAVWGRDPRYASTSAQQTWVQIDYVYYFEIAQVINNVQGVDRILTLQIAKHGLTLGTNDVQLAKPASLTSVGDIAGVVS